MTNDNQSVAPIAAGTGMKPNMENPMNDVIWDIMPGQMTRDEMAKYRRDHNMQPATFNYADPEPTMQVDVTWDAIWNEIKTWDINVPTEYGGYCGATGNHVTAIYLAIQNALNSKEVPF